MKTPILTILLLLTFAVGKAQNSVPAKISNMGKTPTIFVDSVEVDQNWMKNTNPDNIETVNVVKGGKYPNGAIYITLKDHSNVPPPFHREDWLSLQQATESAVANEDKQKPRLYLLDNQLITDTTAVRIPAGEYYRVKVISATEAPYFKAALPNVLLINISTVKPDGVIRIRGEAKD